MSLLPTRYYLSQKVSRTLENRKPNNKEKSDHTTHDVTLDKFRSFCPPVVYKELVATVVVEFRRITSKHVSV